MRPEQKWTRGGHARHNPYGGERRQAVPPQNQSSFHHVLVENIHFSVTQQEVAELFSLHGGLASARLEFDSSDRSTGVAHCYYVTLDDAHAAIHYYHTRLLENQPLSCKLQQQQHARSATATTTITDRLGPKHILQRLGPVKGEIEDRLGPKPSQPQQHQQQRSSSSYNTTSRGGRFGGRSNGRGGRHNSNSRAPKKPLTQADLDADMDSFMTGGGDVIAENRGMAIAAEENGFVVMGDAGDEDDSASKNIQDPRKIISYGEL